MKHWWRAFLHVFGQWWIAFDQFAHATLALFFPLAWLGTWADETLSCRAYRTWRDGKPWGKVWMPIIDGLFFWQRIRPDAIGHCHQAYLRELTRHHFPPEMR
jgi:hypothetical protein